MSSVAKGSSSHITLKKIKYDVFISFRGEDTRSNITSLIHSALCLKKIEAFIDEEDLKKGNEISPTLLKAIEESKLCLVILSEDYASSRWCLDELVHILQCKKTEGQVEVIPIFYKVDPSDVRKQQEIYAGAFAKLRKHFDDKKLQEWRKALDKIGNLSGWTSKESGYVIIICIVLVALILIISCMTFSNTHTHIYIYIHKHIFKIYHRNTGTSLHVSPCGLALFSG